MSQKYYRPAARNRTEIEILRSRFITTVERTETTEEARHFISEIRGEMPDASHHVYAFRVGYGNSVIEGMSDDGEPSGTSGPPTLAVLRGSDIGDVAVVTTRYFGGTKLGTGGLVRAYTESAKEALATLALDQKAPKLQIGLDIAYSTYENVKRLVEEYHGTLDDEAFAAEISMIITFLKEDYEPFESALVELTAGQVEPILLATIDED